MPVYRCRLRIVPKGSFFSILPFARNVPVVRSEARDRLNALSHNSLATEFGVRDERHARSSDRIDLIGKVRPLSPNPANKKPRRPRFAAVAASRGRRGAFDELTANSLRQNLKAECYFEGVLSVLVAGGAFLSLSVGNGVVAGGLLDTAEPGL